MKRHHDEKGRHAPAQSRVARNMRGGGYTVHEEDGYVKVRHPSHGTVCAGRCDPNGQLRGIEFTDKKFLHNSIRQPAMVAMQKWEKGRK